MISRRTVLRGLGAAVALPLLDAMTPLQAFAATQKAAPLRMAYVFVPNGIEMQGWTPATEGIDYELTPILKPLANIKSSLNVLTGLTQHNAEPLADGPGDHARSASAFLTGIHPYKTAGDGIHLGISADQVAAQKIGTATPFPSLEIGCERPMIAGDCDSGYSCAYSSNISWKGPATPMAKEVNPRLVFERLFGGGDASERGESLAKRNAYRLSVLDMVWDDASRLRGQLGSNDKRKLDEYMTGVRDIERQLQMLEGKRTNGAVAMQPAGNPVSFGEHIRLMCDMMVLAFQSDLTRICTFMIANEGSNRSYEEAGVPEGHHDISHHGGHPDKLAKKGMIDTFHVSQFAYLVNKLQAIKEGGGTLLDNCMIVYGGGISDGNAHNHNNLPVLLAGKAGGKLKHGRHIRYPDQTPMNNLHLSMLDRMGVPVESLGDSTGKLATLF
jgi:hypothetical protein